MLKCQQELNELDNEAFLQNNIVCNELPWWEKIENSLACRDRGDLLKLDFSSTNFKSDML